MNRLCFRTQRLLLNYVFEIGGMQIWKGISFNILKYNFVLRTFDSIQWFKLYIKRTVLAMTRVLSCRRCSIQVCWIPLSLWRIHVLLTSFVFIYVFWCPRFLYQMMFVSFSSNTTDAICGSGTINPFETHEFTQVFTGVRVSRSSVFCMMCCRSLFVLFWGAIV